MSEESKDIKSIFLEALEKNTAEERKVYLDRVCGNDANLRAEFESLLKAHGGAGDFLEFPAMEPGATLENTPLVEEIGTKIGHYELLELIGEGGMGLVYLVQQREPVKRRVALKIIKPGMDSKQVIARFEAERQALALLDHPNIAHVFDAGTTEAGRPYFAMEYVKGMSITRYCDDRKLTIEQRLQLFRQVCEGLHYAHQKGIIHRDIKPSNILVSVHGDRAVPKIIDFGIAKATARTLTEKTVFTNQGQLLGTPEYMSPEQVDLATQDIDTRSDIYSLGVLLYELLTGVLPFDSQSFRGIGFSEIQRTIRELEPATPSIRFSNLGKEAQTIAIQRQTQVVPLARRLHRELEWIPMKAMRKERVRRYRSASEFTDDIQNYLNGSPLIAGPETALYRAKKFVRRHAGSVATVALVAIAVVLGLIGTTTMYLRSERALSREMSARTRAEQAENVADEQREIAEKQRSLAEERVEEYRRSLYVNRIALAKASYNDGNISRVRELLESCPEDLRAWEWNRLNHILDRSNMVLRGHVQMVRTVAFSPDGKRIATGSYDKTIKIWDTATGDELMTLRGHEDTVGPVSFSPDGERIVSGSADKTIRVWNTANGGEIAILSGHTGPVGEVEFSPNGARIISCGAKSKNSLLGDNTIRIWDAKTGKQIMSLSGHDGPVHSITYNAKGDRIASGGRDKAIRIWDAEKGTELTTLEGHEGRINSVKFSTDGKYIVSGSEDSTVRIWDISTGAELITLRDNKSAIYSVAVSSDGRRIASGSRDRIVRLWDTTSDFKVMTFIGHAHYVTSVAFSPNSEHIVSGGLDKTARIWNVTNDHKRKHLGAAGRVVGFSPDGKSIVSGGRDGTIRVLDAVTATELAILRGHDADKGSVFGASFSPDGRKIISSSMDRTTKIWDIKTETELMTLRRERGCVDARFSPDGRWIVSWSPDYWLQGPYDNTIKLHNAETGDETITLSGHDGEVQCVAFSPDSTRIVSCDRNGIIKIWNVKTGDEMITLNHSAFSVLFSPDGSCIASGGSDRDKTIKLWDSESGIELMALKGHDSGIGSLAFSPDGKRLVSGGRNSIVKLWDVDTGFELMDLQERGKQNTWDNVCFSPDGKTIAIGNDGVILLESEAPSSTQM